jgi:multidrug efflux pump subunit AcrB
MSSLWKGMGVALFAMYCLLTLEFRSYFQPMLILLAIPFGWMGAIWGHYALGLPLTIFSVFGLVSLTGVVVNDSIVLVDFINRRIRRGVPLRKGLLEAGRRRFRPVLLTSVTTVAGLTPLLLERSFQAQVLIPMAASLSFGLMASTAVVLLLVPTLYSVYARGIDVAYDPAEELEYEKPARAASVVTATARPSTATSAFGE